MNTTPVIVSACLAAALTAARPVGCAEPPPALVRVPMLTATRAAADVWTLPPVVAGFRSLNGMLLPAQQTEVRLAFDEQRLYIAFRCFEDRMDELVTEYKDRDSWVHRDDSVAVFLVPDPRRGGYFQLGANAAGAMYDEKDIPAAPESWDGTWRIETGREESAWTALFSIPFADLGVDSPKPGDRWMANFARREKPHDEQSCWSPVGKALHQLDRFGVLEFVGAQEPAASISPVQVALPGKQKAAFSVHNPGKSALFVRAEYSSDGEVIAADDIEAGPGLHTFDREFDFEQDGKRELSIRLADSSTGAVIARTPPIPVRIPPHLSRLTRYRSLVDSCAPHTESLARRKSEAETSLGAIAAFALTAHETTESWAALGAKLDAAAPELFALRYACSDSRNAGYAVGWETTLVKILRDEGFEGPLSGPARIEVARGEYEAVQVVLIAYDRALTDVRVSVGDLLGPDGASIPASEVDIALVGYVKTGQPEYEVDYVGWYPDPLMEIQPFEVPEGKPQPVWLTVHPGPDTPAGVYRGEVTVRPAGMPETAVPVQVTVWDFSLPRETHLKTAFALFEHELGAWYGENTPEIRRRYYQFLLDRRINPTNIYSAWPIPRREDMQFSMDRGLNAFCLGYLTNWGSERRADFVKDMREYEAWLREKGWWDKGYVYGFDEIPRSRYHELRDMFGFVREQFPDLPRMCTVVPNEELRGYVDIWVPLTAGYDHRVAGDYTSRGDEVWWYVCCTPHHPYANWFIDYPAIDARILPWMNWKYHVPGILYYALNLWESNRTTTVSPSSESIHRDPEALEAIKKGKRWPEVPWNTFTFRGFNGDGQLIYPGPNGVPLSSVRFECLRDGIEDYEYLWLLRETLKVARDKAPPALVERAERLLEVPDSVVTSLTRYTTDPEALLEARRNIALAIQELGAVE